MIVKNHGVDRLIEDLKRHGHYNIFIENILRNFEKFNDDKLFPELKEIVEKYEPHEIVSDEVLLKEFLKKVFKSK